MRMTVSEVCTLINIEEKSFLKKLSRYEQKITDLGYTFAKEGKGKKAIYTLSKSQDRKVDIKELLVRDYGFNGRYDIEAYIKLMRYIYKSDGFRTSSDIAQDLDMKDRTVERYIRVLRDKLILKPKHICQVKYYGIKKGTHKEVLDITDEMYNCNFHKQFYFQDTACENCIGQARKEILEYLNVINIWKIYKQDFSNEFIDKVRLDR